MNTISQTLFTGWNFMRALRLVLGVYIAIQAFTTHDSMLGFFSTFFLFQAITNTGCCGAQGCSVPVIKKDSTKIEEVEFEEIKNN
jgi:hypothetical protein